MAALYRALTGPEIKRDIDLYQPPPPLLLILKVLQFLLRNPEMYAYVGTVTGLPDGTTRGSNLESARDFYVRRNVLTSAETHAVPYA
jgi:hypothetical protein